MDPVSITSLVVAISQIISSVYSYGKGLRAAPKEINHLCCELFALKAALEHVKWNVDGCGELDNDADGSDCPLSPSAFKSGEFREVVLIAESFLNDLLLRLENTPGHLRPAVNRLTCPMKSGDIKDSIARLQRLKSYFILATTADNM
jgi:hypothetical protein